MSTSINLEFVRSRFPALSSGTVYLDNAGGTQIVADVVTRAVDYLTTCNVQPILALGGLAAVAANRLVDARRRLAEWINAESDTEVVLGASTTLLLHLLCQSFASTLSPEDEIVVTDFDHEANIGPWVRLQAAGITIRTWRVRTPSYQVSLEDLEGLLTPKTRLVCLSHCSNVFGTINPIEQIADLVHGAGALLCVDGVAYAPHREIDVRRLKADFYVFSLYKTFGPHYALLYGRAQILRELPGLNYFFISRDAIPYKLQPGGTIFELVYAAAGIVDYLENLGARMTTSTDAATRRHVAYDRIAQHEQLLGERFLSFLKSRTDIRVLGARTADPGVRLPIFSFVVDGRDSREVSESAAATGLTLRYGDFYAHRYFQSQESGRPHGALRVSFAHYTSLDDVERLIASLSSVL